MTKWDKLFGLEHPEAYGEIKDPEDTKKSIYNTDVEEINYYMLKQICDHLKLDTTWINRFYAKTWKQQRKEHGR